MNLSLLTLTLGCSREELAICTTWKEDSYHASRNGEEHLLHYYDGRFSNDQMFSLFLFNTIERHNNNTQGNFFFKSEYFIGKNPPTIENLKEKLAQGMTNVYKC